MLQFIVVMIDVTLLKWLGILQRNPAPAQQVLPCLDTAVTLHLPEMLLAFAHAQPYMVAAPRLLPPHQGAFNIQRFSAPPFICNAQPEAFVPEPSSHSHSRLLPRLPQTRQAAGEGKA